MTNFANHIDNLSHDKINRYLKNSKTKPSFLWKSVKDDIIQSDNGYIYLMTRLLTKIFRIKYKVLEVNIVATLTVLLRVSGL